jgi:hypothetical protein
MFAITAGFHDSLLTAPIDRQDFPISARFYWNGRLSERAALVGGPS